MALDDFMGDSSSSSNSSSNNESPSSSSSTKDQSTLDLDGGIEHIPNIDGIEDFDYGSSKPKEDPFERDGILAYEQMADLAKTATDTIKIEQEHIKYHMPIFQMVCTNPEYSMGERYSLAYTGEGHDTSWSGRVVTCLGGFNTSLGSLSRESVMVEAGSSSKSDIIAMMREQLGEDIESDTLCYVYFFADTLHIRDLAQASNMYMAGNRIIRDKFVHHILNKNKLVE